MTVKIVKKKKKRLKPPKEPGAVNYSLKGKATYGKGTKSGD